MKSRLSISSLMVLLMLGRGLSFSNTAVYGND